MKKRNLFKSLRKTSQGFTLIELLIIVGLIAFLAILISAYLRSQIFKSYDSRRKAEIKRIGIAVEEYEKDNDCYPLPSLLSCSPGTGLRPYIDKIPCDPTTEASYMYEHEDSTCPKWYKIYGKLDNEADIDYTAYIGPNGAFSYVYESPNSPATVPVVQEGSPTPGPGGSDPIPQTDFYGCISGVCTLIQWNPSRPGPACDPNYQNSTCYGQCSNPANECEPWGN